MIVYGQRSTLVKTELIHEPCPNCGKNFSVQMNVFQRYAHIFWIPVFPIGKTGVSQCTSCGQVLKEAFMSDALKSGYKNLTLQSKAPIWTFSGLAIAAIIIACVIIDDRKQSKLKDQCVSNPKKGDILQVKEDSIYTLYKILDVSKDSVYFVANSYKTDLSGSIADIEDRPYETTEYVMPKSKLVEMNNNDRINDVERK